MADMSLSPCESVAQSRKDRPPRPGARSAFRFVVEWIDQHHGLIVGFGMDGKPAMFRADAPYGKSQIDLEHWSGNDSGR